MGWVGFGLMEEHELSEVALERLVRSAFTDGMLPEAYDPEGSGSAVRTGRSGRVRGRRDSVGASSCGVSASVTISVVAASGAAASIDTPGDLRMALAEIGRTCKSCHEAYRE